MASNSPPRGHDRDNTGAFPTAANPDQTMLHTVPGDRATDNITTITPENNVGREREHARSDENDIMAQATAEILSGDLGSQGTTVQLRLGEPRPENSIESDDLQGIAGLWSAESDNRTTEHIVDLIHAMTDGTKQCELPFDDVMNHCTNQGFTSEQVPVSYTHLTLPTTPYV